MGIKTCEGYPGIEGHEETDANTFAEWGIDYIKIDGCFMDERKMDIGELKIYFILKMKANKTYVLQKCTIK